MRHVNTIIFALASVCALNLNATVLYDEAVDGDISGVPTIQVPQISDTYTISGSIQTPGDSGDTFFLNVPFGFQISSVRWEYNANGVGSQTRFLIRNGHGVAFLNHLTVVSGPEDILDAGFSIQDPALPLSSNVYTVEIGNNITALSPYTVTLVVETADWDGDGVGDANDNCVNTFNPDQANLDGDIFGDLCDSDIDGDAIDNNLDNCPETANGAQDDNDLDGLGDACDADDDNDGVMDMSDNCPFNANPSQSDLDGDGIGDVCDSFTDQDMDGVADMDDNCPADANPSQNDFDMDGEGDTCDSDVDGDGTANDSDSCPMTEVGMVVHPASGCSIAQLVPCEGPRGTTREWRSKGRYVGKVARTAVRFHKKGLIDFGEKVQIISDALQSDCGKRERPARWGRDDD